MADESETLKRMSSFATEIRKEVVGMATKQRNGDPTGSATWISELSRLSGYILDYIGFLTEEILSQKHGKRPFQLRDFAKLLWAWSTADRTDPEIYDIFLEQMIPLQEKAMGEPDAARDFQAQQWSNTLWAVAKAELDSLKSYVQLLELVAKLLERYLGYCDRINPQDISTIVWSVASLLSLTHEHHPSQQTELTNRRREELAALSIVRSTASYVIKRGTSNFNPQHLSNTVWAMATLGFGLGENAAELSVKNNHVVIETNDPAGDQEMMRGALFEIVSSSIPHLPKSDSQYLSNLAWSIARLVDGRFVKSQPTFQIVLDGVAHQLSDERCHVSWQAIGMTLWSLATLEIDNESLYRALASRYDSDKVRTDTTLQGLSTTLWALASAEIQIGPDRHAFETSPAPESLPPNICDPVVLTFAMAGRELILRPQRFSTRQFNDVLWSFSKIGIHHPQLFKSAAQHILEGYKNNRTNISPTGFDDFCAQTLATTAWSFARQSQLAAQRTASLRVGDRHTSFMKAIKKEFMDRTSRYLRGEINVNTKFTGQQVGIICWAMATLNIPAGDLIRNVTPYIATICQGQSKKVTALSIANAFSRQALASTAWACAVFGEYPPALMDILYTGLVGSTSDEDSVYMAQIHGDEGFSLESIRMLIYVHVALQLSDSRQKKSLPYDFPENWQQLSTLRNDHMTDTFDKINLRTSNLQQAVSKAFSRIGFHHVEEHVITAEEMANDHGIDLGPKPFEILSIDIANVEQKIAIEVDGPTHFLASSNGDVEQEEEGPGHSKVTNEEIEYQFLRADERYVINGGTALKQRLLRSLGWKVIQIPFWEWDKLERDETAENGYCAMILEQSGVSYRFDGDRALDQQSS